jgi:hypothetical protein
VPSIRDIRLATGHSRRSFAVLLDVPFETYHAPSPSSMAQSALSDRFTIPSKTARDLIPSLEPIDTMDEDYFGTTIRPDVSSLRKFEYVATHSMRSAATASLDGTSNDARFATRCWK